MECWHLSAPAVVNLHEGHSLVLLSLWWWPVRAIKLRTQPGWLLDRFVMY